MPLGKKKLLAVFLEKDNLKLLVFDVFGNRVSRVFAGQITFSSEVLRDAYIADSAKFSGQLKIAFSQKDQLREVSEVVLFVPPDKTFTKSLAATDSVDGFIQSLPYFKEELILGIEEVRSKGSKEGKRVTYVAFEKKLIEDFQRPFLESGKRVVAVKSSVNVLAASHVGSDKYFLLVPFEKEIAGAVVEDGRIVEMAAFGKDVFLTRFGEYVVNHGLQNVSVAYTVGVFDAALLEQLKSTRGLTVTALANGDIYDTIVGAYLRTGSGGILSGFLGRVSLFNVGEKLPSQKYLFLAGAIVVGGLLVWAVAGKLGGVSLPGGGGTKVVTPTPAPTPVPTPEPKPEEYQMRVLNGTLVEGEAGRLATKMTDLGFEVVEKKNATSAGFVATRLRTTVDVPVKIVDMVKSALTETYESVSSEILASASGGVVIEIIIGKKK